MKTLQDLIITFIAYLLILNAIGYFLMKSDKGRARRSGARRVPEKRLFGIALFGGALGVWAGMRAHRHKTKHPSFVYGIPALFVLNVAAAYLLFTSM